MSQIGLNAPIRLLGVLTTNLLFLALALVITRYRGPAGLGNFILAITVYNFLGIGGALGLKQGTLRSVAFYRGKRDVIRLRSVIRISLVLGLVCSAVLGGILFFQARSLAELVFSKPELTAIFRVLGLGVPIFTLATIILAVLQGFKKIKLQVLAENIARPGLAVLLIAVLLWGGGGIADAAGGWIISYLLVFLLAVGWLRRILPEPVVSRPTRGVARSLLAFSLPLLLVGLMHRLLANIDVIMLGYFSPSSAVGIYGIAARLSFLIIVPLEAVDVIFAPMIAEICGREETEKLGGLYQATTRWIIWTGGAAFALLLILASPMMELFGRGFRAGEMVLAVLGAGQLINIGFGSTGFLLTMTGHPRVNLYNNTALGVLNFLLNLYLIPRYGIYGAAVATAASWTVVNIVRLIEIRLILGIVPFSRGYWIPWITLIAAGVISVAALRLLPPSLTPLFSRAIIGLIFFGIYGFIFVRLGLGEEERSILNRFFSIRRNK